MIHGTPVSVFAPPAPVGSDGPYGGEARPEIAFYDVSQVYVPVGAVLGHWNVGFGPYDTALTEARMHALASQAGHPHIGPAQATFSVFHSHNMPQPYIPNFAAQGPGMSWRKAALLRALAEEEERAELEHIVQARARAQAQARTQSDAMAESQAWAYVPVSTSIEFQRRPSHGHLVHGSYPRSEFEHPVPMAREWFSSRGLPEGTSRSMTPTPPRRPRRRSHALHPSDNYHEQSWSAGESCDPLLTPHNRAFLPTCVPTMTPGPEHGDVTAKGKATEVKAQSRVSQAQSSADSTLADVPQTCSSGRVKSDEQEAFGHVFSFSSGPYGSDSAGASAAAPLKAEAGSSITSDKDVAVPAPTSSDPVVLRGSVLASTAIAFDGGQDAEDPGDADYDQAAARRHALATLAHLESAFATRSDAFAIPAHLDFVPVRVDAVAGRNPTALLAFTENNRPLLMHEHALNELLEKLDAVESHGDEEVRVRRRALVMAVAQALGTIDRTVAERKQDLESAAGQITPATLHEVLPALVHQDDQPDGEGTSLTAENGDPGARVVDSSNAVDTANPEGPVGVVETLEYTNELDH